MDVAIYGWVVLLLLLLLPVVHAQAPGDGDSFCTSPSILLPTYPPNTKILMDSYSYLNLLPSPVTPAGGVWQEVDVDGELGGITTQWQLLLGIPCRQSVYSCHYLAPSSQNNWLISQHISRQLPEVGKLPQVMALIEFHLSGCSLGCQASFQLEVLETSIFNRSAARNISNYRQIQRISPKLSIDTLQNVSVPVKFLSDASGFYLAIVDENSCITISRVLVFYYVCNRVVLDLASFPETLSPPHNSSSFQTVEVEGQCSEGASTNSSLKPSLLCSETGNWVLGANAIRCECSHGYRRENDSEVCSSCPKGQYFSSSISMVCQLCPPNTRSVDAPVTECPCEEGYFRAAHESADFPCTQLPSECWNLKLVSVHEESVVVQWNRPNITGRPDFYYSVSHSNPNTSDEFAIVKKHLVNSGSVVSYRISNLLPGQMYQLKIIAHNNVSGQDEANNSMRACEVNVTTLDLGLPGTLSECTELVVVSNSEKDVMIQWSRPAITGGLQFYYKVFHSDLNTPGSFLLQNGNFSSPNLTVIYKVSNLVPSQKYRIRVTTHNNVSNRNPGQQQRMCEVTAFTQQEAPGEVTEVWGVCSVVTWLPPLADSGRIQQYEVRIQPGGKTRLVTVPFYSTSDEERRRATTVQVRAITAAGTGPYSRLAFIGCKDSLSTSCPADVIITPSVNFTNVYRFELGGVVYLNNTIVLMEDIGEGLDALHCYSTYELCCSSGEFIFPNGSFVPPSGRGSDLYKSGGVGNGFIRLNRRGTPPLGRYQCLLPMRNGLNASLFTDIVSSSSSLPVATAGSTTALTTESSSSSSTTTPPASVESTTSVQTEISTSRSQVTTLASESTTEGVSTGVQQQQITTMQQLPGFYFMLNGKILRNNSNLNLEDVGENDGGLLCVSEDNPFCCDRVGEFYYPNNTKVPVNKFGHDLWRNRGDSFIRLNRRITASLPAYGTYRCEIPYSQNFHENIYFTIVSSIPFGNAQALSSYQNGCPENRTAAGTCFVPVLIATGSTFLATTIMALAIVVFCVIRYKMNKRLESKTEMRKTDIQIEQTCN